MYSVGYNVEDFTIIHKKPQLMGRCHIVPKNVQPDSESVTKGS